MRMLTAAALCRCLPAVALSDEPWPGVWSANPAWCDRADRIGSVIPAPIALAAGEMRGYENTCTIEGAEQVGGLSASKLSLACQAEGSRYEDEMLVLLSGPDALWQFSGTEPVRFTRCGG